MDNERTVKVIIKGDGSSVEKELTKTQRLFNNFSKAGAVAFAAIGTAAVAFGVKAVKAYGEAEEAQKRTLALLKATGYQAGVTGKEIFELGAALQKTTTYSDEAIIGLQNTLLKFRNIKEDIFEPTTRAVADMASALNINLTTAAQSVGRALEDPIGGINALKRAGIQFTEDQKEQIKGFIAVNDVAGAQAVILKELESRFKGSAEAMANGTGVFLQIKEDIGEIFEAIGKAIFEQIQPALIQFRDWLRDIKEDIGGLPAIIDGVTRAINALKVAVASLLAYRVFVWLTAAITAFTSAGAAVAFWTVRLGLTLIAVKALQVAQLLLNRTMMANPYGLLAAAIVGLITYSGGLEKAILNLTAAWNGFLHSIGRIDDAEFNARMDNIVKKIQEVEQAARDAEKGSNLPATGAEPENPQATDRTVVNDGKSSGGGGASNDLERGLGYEIPAGATSEEELALLIQSNPALLKTPEQRESYLSLLNDQKQEELDVVQKYHQRLLQEERDFRYEMNSTVGGALVQLLSSEKDSNAKRQAQATQTNADLLILAQTFGEKHKGVMKAFNIAQAVMNTYTGATKALADWGWPAGPIFAALTVAAGMAQVANIAGAAQGGIVEGIDTGRDNRMMAVRSGEMIVPPQYVKPLMPTLAGMIKQEERTGMINSGGGEGGGTIVIELKGEAGQLINATLIRDRAAGVI